MDASALLLRALAGGADGDELADAARHTMVVDVPPTWLALHAVNRTCDTVELVGSSGLPYGLREPLCSIPSSVPLPITAAVDRIDVVVVAVSSLDEDYPLGHFLVGAEDAGDRTLVVVPALTRSAVVGVVSLEFERPPAPTWDMLRRLEIAADALAAWTLCHPDLTGIDRRSRPSVWLTERQQMVLSMVATGLTNAQIARELDYSIATVKADLSAMYRVFGVRSRDELVHRASRTTQ
ncbi:MAG: response regulator transcription factor [Ilumatobacteraceae bacterium]